MNLLHAPNRLVPNTYISTYMFHHIHIPPLIATIDKFFASHQPPQYLSAVALVGGKKSMGSNRQLEPMTR